MTSATRTGQAEALKRHNPRLLQLADLNKNGAWHVLGYLIHRIEEDGSATPEDIHNALACITKFEDPGNYMTDAAAERKSGSWFAQNGSS